MNFKELDLANLDFQNIGSWPQSAKILACAVIALFLLIFGYFIDLSSQFDELSVSRQKESDLKQIFEVKQAKAVNLDTYRAQMTEIERTFGSLLRQLPSRNEVADLLTDISQTGLSSGLKFELFKPKPEIPADFYAELPIEIRVRGNYHEFGNFVGGLASLPRIVTLHDFKIYNEQREKGNELIMEATAKTYRYLDEKELQRLSGKP